MNEETRIAIERWMLRASNDLRTAQTMLTVDTPTTDTICFHAQQCVEKGLKAYLTCAGRHIERTHDLVRLVVLCKQSDPAFDTLVEGAVCGDEDDRQIGKALPDGAQQVDAADAWHVHIGDEQVDMVVEVEQGFEPIGNRGDGVVAFFEKVANGPAKIVVIVNEQNIQG